MKKLCTGTKLRISQLSWMQNWDFMSQFSIKVYEGKKTPNHCLMMMGHRHIRRPNMTSSSHHSYWIVVMFRFGHSYGWSKLSQFEFKHKRTVPKLNVCSVNLICLFCSILTLAWCSVLIPMYVLLFSIRQFLREWDSLNCHSGLPIVRTRASPVPAVRIPAGESSCKPNVIIFPSSILFKWCSMWGSNFCFRPC